MPMAYLEQGQGDPIVLVHGNPTSSYLWRKVIPELSKAGRCIAPDLIGMGDSAKVFAGANTYTFSDHQAYLEAFLHAMGIERDVTLVGHDWGGPLVFDWGRRHPGSVRAMAYMETIVTPITWDDWPERSREFFRALRSDAGEDMILRRNLFVERVLPASVLDPLPPAVLDVYRSPYRSVGESRRPTLTWPREVPIEGEPKNVADIVADNERWLEGPEVPKLFVNAEPGGILVGRPRQVCRSWANQTEIAVRGIHFVQEDSGEAIGQAIASWLTSL